jgi:integrase
MPKKLLTDRYVANVRQPRAGRRFIVYDVAVPGLQLRITPGGYKSFVLGARFNGSKHYTRRVIGTVGRISLAAARDQARAWLLAIKSGQDPAQSLDVPNENIYTSFGDVAEAFIARHLPGQRKGTRVAREIRTELVKHWGQLPIAAITRRHVVELIDAIVDRPAPRHAHSIFSHIRLLFGWAINRGIYGIETSPCDRLRPIQLIGPKRTRERVLNDDELRALWAATADWYPYGSLVRLLLLCGARLNEIAKARYDEVDFTRRVLTVPAERFKAGSQHVIPLSDDAVALLQGLPQRGQFLFTSSGVRPVGDFFMAKNRLDAAMGIASFQFHDLRRTFRTRLAELRVPDHVAELAIGHAKKGLRRVYDQHAYADEIRAAMEAWAGRLRSIVNPEENVVLGCFGWARGCQGTAFQVK